MENVLESKFQKELIDELKDRFPGCVVLKNDPNYIQGIPDLIFLNGRYWATLECKKSKNSPYRPNQIYYQDMLNKMSFSSFIYPENKEIILASMETDMSMLDKYIYS